MWNKFRKGLNRVLTVLIMLPCCLSLHGCEQIDEGTVTICFDIGTQYDEEYGSSRQEGVVDSFLQELTSYAHAYGVNANFEARVIPSSNQKSTERAAMLQQIRTEIMTGSGPDVFIVYCEGRDYSRLNSHRLFPYVKKSISQDMFLPLNTYLSSTHMMKWEDYLPQVMDAGKDRQENQVVVPLTFTVPITLSRREDFCPPEILSWDDMFSSKNVESVKIQMDWIWSDIYLDSSQQGFHRPGFHLLFSELADFNEGCLSFSEEEMTQLVKDSLCLWTQTENIDLTRESYSGYMDGSLLSQPAVTWILGESGNTDLFLQSVANLEGGTTAEINMYAAVNRNTDHPEESFFVLDCLLSEDFQKGSSIYSMIGDTLEGRMTPNIKMVSPGNRFIDLTFTQQQYEEWLKVCGRISAVHFRSPLENEIEDMVLEIRQAVEEPHRADTDITPEVYGEITDEQLQEIIHRHYKRMCRLVDES